MNFEQIEVWVIFGYVCIKFACNSNEKLKVPAFLRYRTQRQLTTAKASGS